MTSTSVSNLAHAQAAPVLISKTGKLWIAVFGVLFLALHWHFVRYTTLLGMSDADWSHVLIIPLISLYYIHLHRQKLMATPRRVAPIGAAFIYFGITGYIIGSLLLRNPMAQGYSMIMTLFGVVLLLLGPEMMRTLWFPIVFLGFAVKVSSAIWSVVASKMQGFAAYGATALINIASPLTDMDAKLKGSTIHLDYVFNGQYVSDPMNVAEACGGMRMLMAFLALGVALSFLFPRQWWQRLIMVALAAPIAIFVNALRVAVLGWLHLIDKDLATGDFHILVGMFMLIPAAGLLMLVGWCLDKVVIVEGKPPRPPAPLPFEEDPNQINIETKPAVRGLGIGVAVLAVFAGLEVLMIQYVLPAMGFSTVFTGQFSMRGALAQLVMHTVLAVGAWVVVRLILARPRQITAFGTAVGMLLAGAIVHASIIQVSGITLSKKALPLRHSLALEFPKTGGDWQMLHHDPKLPEDIEKELGTKEYFNRYYVNGAAGLSAEELKPLVRTNERGNLTGWGGIDDPGQMAKLHMTYYTGMLDAVPHVPDKCWIVAGQQLVYRERHTLKLAREDYRPDPDHPGMILARSTGFDQQVRLPSDEIEAIVFSGGDADGNVTTALYFFMANGNAIASSHEVRLSFNLKDRYSYYCKVEVMFPGLGNLVAQQYRQENPGASSKDVNRAVANAVAERAEDLLSDLMPEIMACLPDWTEVQAQAQAEAKTEADADADTKAQ